MPSLQVGVYHCYFTPKLSSALGTELKNLRLSGAVTHHYIKNTNSKIIKWKHSGSCYCRLFGSLFVEENLLIFTRLVLCMSNVTSRSYATSGCTPALSSQVGVAGLQWSTQPLVECGQLIQVQFFFPCGCLLDWESKVSQPDATGQTGLLGQFSMAFLHTLWKFCTRHFKDTCWGSK